MINFTPNTNFKYYMYFVAERMNIFWERYHGFQPPYTDDPILQKHKFTNVYRALDRSSQYLLAKVIYNGKQYTKEDMFWRIVLYKNYNLPSTWEHLLSDLGDITLATPKEDIVNSLMKINGVKPVYSNAYMLTCPFMRKESFLKEYDLKPGQPKFSLYMNIFHKDLIERGLMAEALKATTFEELFNVLRRVLSFGDFLAYQIAQDLNYTDFFNLDDNSFCAAGPGTQRGIERCFTFTGKIDYAEVVKWVHANFAELVKVYGIDFKGLPHHYPTVCDLSNVFCETDKMLRGVGVETEGKEIEGKRIKQVFNQNNEKIKYVFPPKWGVNL